MKYVYMFSEGNANMRELLGGKGANLAEMTNLGLPVPFGFTVTTEACTRYYDDGKMIAKEIIDEIFDSLKKLEKKAGKQFGNPQNPLGICSPVQESMPGMMDNTQPWLEDETVEGMAKLKTTKDSHMTATEDSFRCSLICVMEIEKKSSIKYLTQPEAL